MPDPWPATAHRPSAAELLLAEVALLLATSDCWLAAYVLADLDDRGFLDCPAGAIAARLGVGADRVERVIQPSARLAPGICAVDATDCLLRQLEPFEAHGQAPTLLRTMIAGHLGDMARGRIGAVALALGTGRAEVLAARAFLRDHLRPWATLPEPSPLPVPAPPDLVVREVPGDPDRLEVEVVETGRLAVRLDPAWVRLAEQGPGVLPAAQHRRVREQVASAQAPSLASPSGLRRRPRRRLCRRPPAGLSPSRTRHPCAAHPRRGRRSARPARVDREPGRRQAPAAAGRTRDRSRGAVRGRPVGTGQPAGGGGGRGSAPCPTAS